VNITPIQPNLAESSLFILNSLGPGSMGFNEFNPLFEYNRMSLQTSGIYGGNNTIGDNTQLSGIHDNLSFSLGQFNYGTDGFRTNNFFKQNLYNAFLQNKINDKLNLQFEYRHEVTGNGDLGLNFDRTNFDKHYSQDTSTDSYRIGGHYEFNPKSSLITSAIYQSVDIQQNDPATTVNYYNFPGQSVITENTNTHLTDYNRRGFISELQHNFNDSKYNFINGVGYVDQSSIQKDTLGSSELDVYNPSVPGSPFFTVYPTTFNVQKNNFKKGNFYNYSKIYFPEKLTLTLGFSVDWYNSLPVGQIDENFTLLNPKFGLMWSPDNATTFRAALFRASSIARNATQTIEPTQVAGFNQFFDDVLGTISWRSGIGIDHKFSNKFSTGLEFSKRNLDVVQYEALYRSEQIGRAYFNFMPNDQFSLGLEYFYEKINQAGLAGLGIFNTNAYSNLGLFNSVETHRIPLTVNFFDTSGFSIKIKNSFVHQSGVFQNLNAQNTSDGVSDFFVSDLNLSYRIPNRHGMISVGVNNLFNNKFNYQNTDYNDVTITPGRLAFSKITLVF
jgi:hypothetical protein